MLCASKPLMISYSLSLRPVACSLLPRLISSLSMLETLKKTPAWNGPGDEGRPTDGF